MGKTNIEWADETWPITRGCTRISAGCEHCYAEAQAARIIRMGKGKPTKYDGLVKLVQRGDRTEPRWTGTARFCPEELATPLRMRKQQRIFVSSMSDLFHDDITNEQIAAVFGVMAACPQHTFQVLTKRAERLPEWFEWVKQTLPSCHPFGAARGVRWYAWDRLGDSEVAALCSPAYRAADPPDWPWPLPNVMIGVSVENQAAADERIPHLLATPAAVRWISAEPLLGPLDLDAIQIPGEREGLRFGALRHLDARFGQAPSLIDLVIAGCESGTGARPCDVAWLRTLRDQCAEAGAAFFLKQAHRHTLDRVLAPDSAPAEIIEVMTSSGARYCDPIAAGPGSHRKPGGIIGAPYLDGVQHLAMPTTETE